MTSLTDSGNRNLETAETGSDKPALPSVEDLEGLSLSDALLIAYFEAADKCVKIEDPQPSMMKGIASVWGMGDLFGPHITVIPQCEEEDIGESLKAIWSNVGEYMWTAIDDQQSPTARFFTQ